MLGIAVNMCPVDLNGLAINSQIYFKDSFKALFTRGHAFATLDSEWLLMLLDRSQR